MKWSATEVLWTSLALLLLTALILRSANRITIESAGPPTTGKLVPLVCFSGLFLSILGAKLYLIDGFGSDVPIWDQWDAEGLMYPKLLAGSLDPSLLISAHNEHRILVTRLLACCLLQLNGQWGPLLQMAVNAAIHGLVLTGLAVVLWRLAGRKYLPLFCVIIMLIGILPFSWENTLAGFQSQFYFLLGFSITAILILLHSRPFSPSWFLGIASVLCAQFSMASGLMAPLAIGFVALIQIVLDRDRSHRYLPTIIAVVILAVIGSLLVPHVPYHDALKIKKPLKFLSFFLANMAWPLWKLPVLCAPLFILSYRSFRARRLEEFEAFLLCLGVWVLLQDAAMAYSRGPAAPRYRDINSIGLVVNFSALLLLARSWLAGAWRYRAAVRIATLVLVISSGLLLVRIGVPREVVERPSLLEQQEENTAGFVLTGDKSFLVNKPLMCIPYPSGERLAFILSDPALREVLPACIRAPLPFKEAECNGFAPRSGPPGLSIPTYRTMYGSSHIDKQNGPAVWLSQPLESRFPWLVFDIAGGGPGTSLEMLPEGKSAISVPLAKDGIGLRQVIVRAPEGPFRLKATNANSNSGLAFSLPRELAAGSYWAATVISKGRALAVAGLIILITGMWAASRSVLRCCESGS